jgi:hypothetical protein
MSMKENLMRRIGGWSLAISLLVAAFVASLGTGCAQDVGDVDRTQPGKIEKAQFQTDDEWYYRQTIIDTDTQGSGIFEALESPLKRVRWEVTEDILYAYSTVPLADGLQDEYTAEDSRRLGVVAAYPITGHFDVQRQYNASTGEQTNVLVENASDRPWFEREYMRVNWSGNQVSGQGNFAPYFGAMSALAEDRPATSDVVDPDRRRITKDVIDFTTRYSFQPDILACAYNVGALEAVYSCEGGRASVRSSFLRIKPEEDNDYKPFMMTDNKRISEEGDADNGALYTTTIYDPVSRFYFEAECTPHTKNFLRDEYGDVGDSCQPATFGLFSRFGYFRTDRFKWDEEYPNQDVDRRHYANRWDIWQTAFNDDGSTMDLAKRDPEPIVYHLNVEYPRDMIGAAEEVERQWNNAFLETVQIAKGYGSVDEVKSDLAEMYDGDERMFKIMQNSCMPKRLNAWRDNHGGSSDNDRKDIQTIFDDHMGGVDGDMVDALWAMPKESRVNLCAELEWATETRDSAEARFSWERVGDLRYSFFNWIDEFNGYWSGYGPSAADPLTGEIVSGNANFSGTPLRSYASGGTDIIQYINHELSNDDIRTGEYVREYLANKRADVQQQSLKPELPVEAQREMIRRAGNDPAQISPTNFSDAPSFAEQDDFIKRWGKDRIMMEADRLSKTITEAKKSDTRLIEFYDQPDVKQMLMRDADFSMSVRALAHEYFGAEPDESQMHQAYLDMATPKDVLRRSERFDRKMAENNLFAADNLQRGLTSLVTYDGAAKAFEGMERSEIRRYLMENAFIGTQLHEVGHTVGLRHNFGSSMDALNYHDGFWKMRRDVATGDLTEGDGVKITPNGTVHISDPELAQKYTNTPDAKYVSSAEMRLPSIMDYTGDMTGRFAGLGKYDTAAITFAYGEHVQQWSQDVSLPNLLWYDEWISDYADLPHVYGNTSTSSQDPQDLADGVEIMLNQREWVSIDDAIKQKREGIVANSQKWESGELDNNNQPYIDRTVPYEFCSDEYSNSRLGCDVFDWGSNHTEVVNHSFNQYRFFQPFWRYMGQDNDRLFSTYSNYIGRLQRTFQMASRPFRYYSIYQWYDLGSYTDDLQRASIDALNFFAEVMATPQPNRYCMWDAANADVESGNVPIENWYYDLDGKFVPNNWLRDDTNCANHIDIKRGEGQYYGFNFTDEYDYRIRRVGTYIDKSLATQALFDISANYAFSSFFTDARATNISFWTLFEDELHGYLSGVILGDYSGFAGRHDADAQVPSYEPPKVVDPKTFGKTVPTPQAESRRIYTTISFDQKFSTLVGGMLTNSSWQDRSLNFSNYVKVAVTNDELQPFPDALDVAELVHPISGQIYQAPQTSNGKSISYELVEHGNKLKAKWLDAEAELATAETDREAGNISETQYQNAWDRERGYQRAFEDTVAKLEMIRYVFEAGRVMR